MSNLLQFLSIQNLTLTVKYLCYHRLFCHNKMTEMSLLKSLNICDKLVKVYLSYNGLLDLLKYFFGKFL